MSITVLNPGLLTTVQDLGRMGYQQFGVSVSGVMDPRAAAIGNILVGFSILMYGMELMKNAGRAGVYPHGAAAEI